jgi:hypothetical protein
LKTAYSYARSKNTIDPGSIALRILDGQLDLLRSQQPGDRLLEPVPGPPRFPHRQLPLRVPEVRRHDALLLLQSYTNGVGSYLFAGDLNGDLGTNNDLLYIPRNTLGDELRGPSLPRPPFGRSLPAEQSGRLGRLHQPGPYLSQHRGEYAGRNGARLPMVSRLDFSLAQDLFKNIGSGRHSLTLRADFLNFSNLLNHDWGVGQRFLGQTTPGRNQPLTNTAVDANGAARYRLRVVNGELLNQTFETTAGLADVYQIQFSLRYSFN